MLAICQVTAGRNRMKTAATTTNIQWVSFLITNLFLVYSAAVQGVWVCSKQLLGSKLRSTSPLLINPLKHEAHLKPLIDIYFTCSRRPTSHCTFGCLFLTRLWLYSWIFPKPRQKRNFRFIFESKSLFFQ